MVLRKRAPPHLYSLNKGNARSEPRSAISQISPTSKSVSSSSPKRLTRPRRAQSSPQPHRLPSQESVFSPDLNTSPAFDLMPLEQAQRSPVRSSPSENMNPWADELVERPGQNHQGYNGSGQSVADNAPPAESAENRRGDRVPSILVASTQRRMAANEWQQNGDVNEAPDWEHVGNSPAPLQSNNPFLKPRQPEQNPWDDRSPRPFSEATSASQDSANARLGQDEGYIPMTARLSLFDSPSESPWAGERSAVPPPILHENQYPAQDPSYPPQPAARAANAQSPFQPPQTTPYDTPNTYPPQPYQQGNQANLSPWNEINTPATVSTANTGSSHVLIDLNEASDAHIQTNQRTAASSVYSDMNGSQPHPIPSENSQQGAAPPLPDRSIIPQPSQPTSDTPVSEQRSETYSIRHVNWTDATGKLRDCPILAQNKNGPCPLLALVNALVLRSSPDSQPPIVRALQTREQISLGLLIEALFDELTTCLGPDDELPDIEALSRFLTMLHTGMNVNPRLTLESSDSVGTFLETSDMKFYGTFGVPLLHGWVAEPSTEADGALTRVAQFYEDIQLLPFRKQEFEDRVFRGGSLTPEEEQSMNDIQVIQHFTEIENATQLSTFGIQHLTEKLPPGSLSILFRNDHFSTLYKHPQNHQLFTLVTDAGYSHRAEIVWESLIDVNGSQSGFFAGDFRPVSHTSTGTSDPSGPRTSSNTGHSGAPSAVSQEQQGRALSPQEQADADYAYALSLQLQEEEQQASGRTPRDRNQRASVPYYPQRPSEGPPPTRHRSTGHRPAQQPERHSPSRDADDVPPPSYEQVANNAAYQSPPRSSNNRAAPYVAPYQRAQFGRRPPGVPIAIGPSDRPKDRNKDCIVM
ncbi:hypothetical protein BDV38DRAFT_282632 [Aspergillus pseudotamarii]|uniref:MINDY deubiquitinase domain-containing protein n=1 Tax=Aspergillus pseudotamarii TaxID=132259 RepID=A0A5N6SUX3_ASPPS|nr:uncharacterized protein BDV38DRAFT_282632 [Aspergillus pseudotamarii]KAE8137697.1 hypothetical protein BDV38DRAFT_282632 [Aspergillus pseudotamarii]